jgi:uncharacterized protein (TIGR03085 family)
MHRHAADERHALAETLRSAGPAAATLCGDWITAELAAHLVMRERSVAEMAGRLPVRRFREHAEKIVGDLAAREPYEQLVAAVDRGPSWSDVSWPIPTAWFWSLPPVSETANLLEYLIHHEDVRRAAPGWVPRSIPVGVQVVVWKRLQVMARLTLRTVPVGLVLAWPAHGAIRNRLAARGAPTVTVTGDAVELALFAFGRQPVAQVDYDGAPGDIDAVRAADISI